MLLSGNVDFREKRRILVATRVRDRTVQSLLKRRGDRLGGSDKTEVETCLEDLKSGWRVALHDELLCRVQFYRTREEHLHVPQLSVALVQKLYTALQRASAENKCRPTQALLDHWRETLHSLFNVQNETNVTALELLGSEQLLDKRLRGHVCDENLELSGCQKALDKVLDPREHLEWKR